MTAYVTLLERCGFEVVRNEFQMYDIFHEGRMPEYDLMASHLEKFALEVGAKEAAEWWNRNPVSGNESFDYGLDCGWYVVSGWTGHATLITETDLIRKATKAGWEKGEGL